MVRSGILFFLVIVTCGVDLCRAQTPAAELVVGFGAHGLRRQTVFNSRAEFRFPAQLAVFRPITGFLITADGASYSYAGIHYDLLQASHWFVAINFAAGAYFRGAGLSLGGVLEFRSGIELGIQATRQTWLGLSFHHLSNASLYDANPGVETIMYNIIYRL